MSDPAPGGLRALVVDDEPPARRRLVRLLEEREGVSAVEACPDAASALEAVESFGPDVRFLDIRMPGMDGFELREHLPHRAAPADGDDVAEALSRVRGSESRRAADPDPTALAAALREALSAEGAPGPEGTDGLGDLADPERWLVARGSRSFVVDPAQVDWIEAAGNYVRLHVGEDAYLVRGSLTGYERALADAPFHRIHRSTIVNVDRVVEIRSRGSGTGTVVLEDGTELALSRRYRRRLEDRLAPPD